MRYYPNKMRKVKRDLVVPKSEKIAASVNQVLGLFRSTLRQLSELSKEAHEAITEQDQIIEAASQEKQALESTLASINSTKENITKVFGLVEE